MSDFRYVTLSFFKENSIDYVLDQERSHLKFNCIYCFSEIKLDLFSTYWECTRCSKEGNLKALIEHLRTTSVEERKSIQRNKVYKPTKELKKIKSEIERLAASSLVADKELTRTFRSIIERLDDFLNYYEGTKEMKEPGNW